MTEGLHFPFSLSCIGEGNGNPLQCSCLENPRNGGAWWVALYGVAQSRTQLKWLSSSSISESWKTGVRQKNATPLLKTFRHTPGNRTGGRRGTCVSSFTRHHQMFFHICADLCLYRINESLCFSPFLTLSVLWHFKIFAIWWVWKTVSRCCFGLHLTDS